MGTKSGFNNRTSAADRDQIVGRPEVPVMTVEQSCHDALYVIHNMKVLTIVDS
jgi:hypothetical protein